MLGLLSVHSIMTFAAWLIGLLGGGGAAAAIVAAVFLGPTAVIAIVQPFVTRFLACTACVVATVFIIATVAAYWLGHHDAAKECRADQLEAEIRNAQFDKAQAAQAAADEKQRADDIEREAKKQHGEDQAYIQQLQSKAPCLFDDSDVGGGPEPRGLRHNAGPGRAKSPAASR